jgi:hypothetical protein
MAGEDAVVVLLRTSAGFAPAPGSPFPVGPGAYSVQVVDLNEDGKPDIISNAFGADSKAVLLGG